jgi:hypothetical protein
MTHQGDGLLRRLYDDPLALTSSARDHIRGCAICRARFESIAANAAAVAPLLTLPAAPVDTAQALARISARLGPARKDAPVATRLAMALDPRTAPRRLSAVIGTVAAVLLAAILALTPAGSFAGSFFTVFQAQQVALLPVSLSELQALPNLSKYGVMQMSGSSHVQTVAGIAAASAIAHRSVLVPGSLPSDVSRDVTYSVIKPITASFTFEATRARAAAAKVGKPLPPMPAQVDGSTLSITIGPVVIAEYGRSTSGSSALLLAQAPAPRVSSSGASLQTILNYLLVQPGISPSLAASIKAIGDPSSTLPIPIPINFAHGQTVQVRGVKGVVVGDNTGIAGGVVWTEHGVIHGAAGTLSEDELLAIVKGLH